MKKRHEMIASPSMGRNMHVWCYGHYGFPILVFPSAAGFAHEWDAQSMVTNLSHLINTGKIKLYCPESNVSRTWTNKEGRLEDRVRDHAAYEHFILETLVPFIYRDCYAERIPIATAGASLGGFYAATFALKFPHIFNYALCLSGRYDLTEFTGGRSSAEVYFNNPLAFVPGLEGEALDHVRKNTFLTLVCGQGAFEEGCIEETIWLGRVLQQKHIPNYIDIWGHDSRHDWNWWKRQAITHLVRRFDA